MSENRNLETDLIVIGGGPAGYAAAFYAADLGHPVTLVDKEAQLGGVCLNHGCLPSKALLHIVGILNQSQEAVQCGIHFAKPKIDLDALRAWKRELTKKLAGGISTLAKARKVEVLRGVGRFLDEHHLQVQEAESRVNIAFQRAIIATGSRPNIPPFFDPHSARQWTSSQALDLPSIPHRLLVVGAGYIGLELGTVYAALGSEVTVIESLDRILTGADIDLARMLQVSLKKRLKHLHLQASVLDIKEHPNGLQVSYKLKDDAIQEASFDAVLVATGRAPNTRNTGLENLSIHVDSAGFIEVDSNFRTKQANIFAIGDCIGGAMLAHKAHDEARHCVRGIYGPGETARKATIPAVVFTHPEIAWCGLTEEQAKASNTQVQVAKFPWGASGKALATAKPNGFTKLLVAPSTKRILGAGIVGHGASELIAELTLAIDKQCTVDDIAETIHPHPTLSETLMEAADLFNGTATHYATPNKKRP